MRDLTLYQPSTLSLSALRLSTALPAVFDLQRPRESSPGLFTGAAGLRLSAGSAHLHFSAHGAFQFELQPAPHGLLHLRLRALTPATVSLDVTLPQPDTSTLLLALLEDHPAQLLRLLAGDSASARWTRFAGACALSSAQLCALLELWPQLSASSEYILLHALASPDSWQNLLHSTAPLLTPTGRLPHLEPLSLPALWASAISGLPPAVALLAAPSDQLRDAARLLHHIDAAAPLQRLSAVLEQRLRRSVGHGLDPFSGLAGPPLPEPDSDRLRAIALVDALSAHFDDALRLTATNALAPLFSHPTEPLLDLTLTQPLADPDLLRRGDLNLLLALPGLLQNPAALTHHLPRLLPIEIHCPFTSCRDTRPSSLQSPWSAHLDAAGRLHAHPASTDAHASAHQSDWELFYSAALRHRLPAPANDNFALAFSASFQTHAGLAPQLYPRLARFYGLPATLPDGHATLTLSLPGHSVELWTALPHPRDPEHLPTFAAISRTLQSALRLWLPLLHFQSAASLRAPASSRPLLVYAASQPYTLCRLGHLTPDHMSAAALDRFLASARHHLQPLLAPAHQLMLAATNPRYPTACPTTHTVLRQLRLKPRYVLALLAAETAFIEEFLHLAAEVHQLHALYPHSPRTALRNLRHHAQDISSALARRLRNLYPLSDYSALEPLLLLTATAALEARLTGASRLTATLRIDTPAGTHVFSSLLTPSALENEEAA